MMPAGETIVHERYGAGTILGTRTIERDGEPKEYYCVELAKGGTLMIPIVTLDEDEFRESMEDTKLIKSILSKQPEDLPSDHRSRRALVEKKLDSRKPRQVAEVLRDLTWRELTYRLTQTDQRLKKRAHDLLSRELSLQDDFTKEGVKSRLDGIIDTQMKKHLDNYEPEEAEEVEA